MVYHKTKYQRKNWISPNECLIYQLIESCLKLDLDSKMAIEAINVVLRKQRDLFDKTTKSTIRLKKMDYRNYRRYAANLRKMSSSHWQLYKEFRNEDNLLDPKLETKKNENLFNLNSARPLREIEQIENLLFLLNDSEDQEIPYKKYVTFDTDELILKALIYLDKKYGF